MKRSALFFILACFLLASAANAFGGPAPTKPAVGGGDKIKTFLIDNFESGSLKSPRDWWTFDLSKVEAASNAGLTEGEPKIAGEVGKYSLHLVGEAKNWYTGGCGTYFAKENQDLSGFTYLQMDIYGKGDGSGTIKVELLDDDNNNWQVEQDAANGYAPTKDDKFVYNILVDWTGWKRISVPLSDFVDDNPGVGDNIWNPTQQNGSGGLVQMQLICVTPREKGKIDLRVDNIGLANSEQ